MLSVILFACCGDIDVCIVLLSEALICWEDYRENARLC